MKNKNVVGLYVRVSTQEQAKEGYSIDEQKERLTKYADARDWIVYRVYADPGFSGAKIERPGLKEMIDDIVSGKLDKIIVYKLDRLSRSQKDTLYLIEDIFLENSVDFVSMTENFDTATPFGRAMIGILSVFAQLEREQIKERMSLGREGRAKSGLFHGSTKVPIGYRYNNGLLIVDPYEARIVRRIFQEYVDGRSIYSIVADLKADGLTSSYGMISRPTIQYILRNPVYTGVIRHVNNIYDGQHEAIITEDLWERASARIESMRDCPNGYNFNKHTSIITGLCYCASCGRKMRFNWGQKRADGHRIRYITCPDKKVSNCPVTPVHAVAVEEYLLNQLKKITFDPKYFEKIRCKSDPIDRSEEILFFNERIKENKSKISKLMDLYTIGGIDFSIVADKIQLLTREVNTLTREIDQIREETSGVSEEEIKERLYTLDEILEEGDIEKTRNVVMALIDRIEIGEHKTVTIKWSF